jgi:hypothetical protein
MWSCCAISVGIEPHNCLLCHAGCQLNDFLKDHLLKDHLLTDQRISRVSNVAVCPIAAARARMKLENAGHQQRFDCETGTILGIHL